MPGAFDEFYAFRGHLVDAVCRDLIGPVEVSNEEVIDDPPFTKYICGVLYPQASGNLDEEQDSDVSDDEDEGVYADPPVAMAHVRYPSSMGISFAVDPTATGALHVYIECARYRPVVPEGETDGAETERGRQKRDRQGKWKRECLSSLN